MDEDERVSGCPFCRRWVVLSKESRDDCRNVIQRAIVTARHELTYWENALVRERETRGNR